MISISLCMIVKNEERVLERCLESLKGLMDEIIIVDTGSTDKTKKIAEKYTNKIYDFKWIDDFSAARNFSFSKATKEYIYVADADEVLDHDNYEKFKKLKQVLLPEIDIVQMYYCNQLEFNTTYNYDKEYRPKLYKRLRQFIWKNPIHECVQIEPIIYDSEIAIMHKPENNHGTRDFAAFQRMIARGETLSAHLHNMYARELFIAGEAKDFLEAETFFKKSITEQRSTDEWKEANAVLVHCAKLKGDKFTFFKHAMKDIVEKPCSEVCCELGAFYVEQEDFEEASNWYYNAIQNVKAILNIRYQEEIPKEGLRFCYEKLEERAEKSGQKQLVMEYNKARKDLDGIVTDVGVNMPHEL